MIIIVGATGFIGTYLIDELLKQGKDILGTYYNNSSINNYYFNNPKIKMIKLDISRKEDFKKLQPQNVEAVILLSSLLPANIKGTENKEKYIRINILGTLNVLNFCKENNIKKIISTTTYADVKNLWSSNNAINENQLRSYSLIGDHAVYTITKNAASDLIEHYNQEFQLQGSIFRLPPVYGAGPHSDIYVNGILRSSAVNTFINNAINGKDIEIWGNRNLKRDIVYIKDVVQAFIKAIGTNKSIGMYNISSGKTVTLEDQASIIIKTFSTTRNTSKIIYKPQYPNNTKSFLFDITKAKNDFNYEPEYTNFKDMMIDYKKELETDKIKYLIKTRIKQ